MKTIKQEYSFGVRQEKILKDKIAEYLSDELINTTDRYDPYDYFSPTKYVELKSRRNKKNQYPTTIIGLDKYDLGMKYLDLGYEIYFVFNFTDEVSCYKLNKEDIFEGIDITRKDRNKSKKHIEININKLKTIYKK